MIFTISTGAGFLPSTVFHRISGIAGVGELLIFDNFHKLPRNTSYLMFLKCPAIPHVRKYVHLLTD